MGNGRWGLWINLFYRNRVSRSACGSGYNLPISVPSSSFKKRVKGDSSFWVRSSCLILTFCRRGMTLLIFGDLLVGGGGGWMGDPWVGGRLGGQADVQAGVRVD